VTDESGFTSLFDGTTLTSWSAIPRSYGRLYPGGPQVLDVITDFPSDYHERAEEFPAAWSVEDGEIIGRQQPAGSGYGGYLITDQAYGDFELRFEANPDWPADTGVMVRRRRDTWEGLQVLIDHRRSGSIGGFYGNGIGGFHAVPFAIDAERDADGEPVGLRPDDPATSMEPFDRSKRAMLTRSADVDEFLSVWRWGDWNAFTVRVSGSCPAPPCGSTTCWSPKSIWAASKPTTMIPTQCGKRSAARGISPWRFTTPTPCSAPTDGLRPRAAAGATSGSGSSRP
jgi:hypothetical protein